ncbi:MAG: R3H domain-containing nucleic acid-binding protein [Candidatus Paceibacterota bacterium]
MITQNNLQKIKQFLEEFFRKTTFEVEVESLSQNESTLSVALKTTEPQILIGEGGQTLFEIQHLLRAILRRKIAEQEAFSLEKQDENFYLDLDINSYKKKKAEYLKELARNVADDVSLTKKERIFSSMSAYERRIIHMELADRSDVSTESSGQEPERKIIVKPRP